MSKILRKRVCRDVEAALQHYRVAAEHGDTESSWNREQASGGMARACLHHVCKRMLCLCSVSARPFYDASWKAMRSRHWVLEKVEPHRDLTTNHILVLM
jgi:hypothetical protein